MSTSVQFCRDFIENETPVDQPLYAYPHDEEPASVTAGVFYQGTNYPEKFRNAFLFGDWAPSWISVLRVDDNDDLVVGSVDVVLTDAGRPVDFEIGPDGDIYYLTSGGQVWHLRYVGSAGTSGLDTSIVVGVAAIAMAVVAVGVIVFITRRRRAGQI